MPSSYRVPVTIIGGLDRQATDFLAGRLHATNPGTAVLSHDLRQISSGVVLRRIRFAASDRCTPLELAHGCVSCTLRCDLLPQLRELADTPGVTHIVLQLDPAMEPDAVCWAMHNVLISGRPVRADVSVDAVVTVLRMDSWLADATGEELLAERGLGAAADDDRTVAQVAIAQAEFADVLVVAGRPTDSWTAAKTGAVLERIAPNAPITELAGIDQARIAGLARPHGRRGMPSHPHDALLRGEPPLSSHCGIGTTLFQARRPFHPERFHQSTDVLLDGVVRTRGRVWLANQPDLALWLESAGGGLGLSHAGQWLAAPDGPRWESVPAERRALAALRWDPVFGDRAQELVIVAEQPAIADIHTALGDALLTDHELAEGRAGWALYPDPFGAR